MQQQLQNHQRMMNQGQALIDLGLLKQVENGEYQPVSSLEEQQLVLQQRQQDAQMTQRLEQLVNQQAPPKIDGERQRAGLQLEPHDEGAAVNNASLVTQIKPPSQSAGGKHGGLSHRAISRRAAAEAQNVSKHGKGGGGDSEMK